MSKTKNDKHRQYDGVFLNLSTFVAHQIIRDSISNSKEISPKLIQVLCTSDDNNGLVQTNNENDTNLNI